MSASDAPTYRIEWRRKGERGWRRDGRGLNASFNRREIAERRADIDRRSSPTLDVRVVAGAVAERHRSLK